MKTHHHPRALFVLAAMLAASPASAALFGWSGFGTGPGSGANTAWLTVGNWTNNAGLPGSADLVFFGSGGSGTSIGINFNAPPAGSTNIGAIVLGGGSTVNRTIGNSSTTAGLATRLYLHGLDGGLITNAVSGRTLTLAPFAGGSGPAMTNVLLASGVIEAVGDIVISANIIEALGARSITKTGPGTLTLNGTNAHTGKMFVNAGTLAIGDENRLGNNPASASADTLTLNGGTLTATAGLTIDDGNRGITLGAGNGTLAGSQSITLSRPIAGPGSLTNNSSGTLILNRTDNTYAGRTILRAGTTRAINDASFGAVPGAYLADAIVFENNAIFLTQDSEFNIHPNRGITIAATGGRLQSGFSRSWGVNSIIAGPGVLTISGDPTPGIVRLNAANTFTNQMIVNNNTGGAAWGLVAVHGSLAAGGVVRVTTNGWLLGTGVINRDVIATNGATLGGGEPGVPGTLTINGTVNLTNAILAADVANPATVGSGVNDLLQINGNLVLAGQVIVRPGGLLGVITPGTYRLANYTGTLTGSAANLVADADGYTVTFDTSTAGEINMTISGTPTTVVWKGTAGPVNAPVWDVGLTPNFAVGLTPTAFIQGQSVLFDNTGFYNVGAVQVPITVVGQSASWGAALPATVTVDVSTNVLLTSAGGSGGKLGGTMSLTKRGAGLLTVTAGNGNFPHDYTGPTTVEAGILRPGFTRAFGATNGPTIATNGGTVDLNNQSLGAEPFIASGAGVGGSGAIVNLNPGGQLNALRYLTLAGDTTVGGIGRWDVRDYAANNLTGARMDGEGYTLTKTGPNQVSFVGTGDTDLGDIIVQQGFLNFEVNSTLGRTTDEVTVMPGATLGFWGSTVFNLKYVRLTNDARLLKDNGNTTNLAPIALLGGTAIIDVANNGGNIYALSNRLEGPGGFAKIGAGILQLATNNSHSGPTIVSNGTLQLFEDASIANSSHIDVKAGATLDLTRKAGAGGLTLASGQTLQGAGSVAGSINAGAGTTLLPGTSPGTLSIASNLTLNGASVVMELSGATTEGSGVNDLITARDLALAGPTTVRIVPLVPLNTVSPYVLARYTNSLTGNPLDLSIVSDSRYTFTPDFATAPLVRVTAAGAAASLVWAGGAPGSETLWNLNTTTNWLNGGALDFFLQADAVTFDDSSTFNNVSLVGALSPGTITFNNNVDYTLGGAGEIKTLSTINKSGSGRLTIANNNPELNGGATISAGILQIGNGGAAGSIGPASVITNNATLVHSRSDSNGLPSVIRGTGALVKEGSGILALAGANLFTGPVTVNNGTLRTASAGALGNAVSVTVNGGGQVDLAGVTPTVRSNSYFLAGAGPDGRGALINSGAPLAGNAGVSNVTLTANAAIGIWGTGGDLGRVDVGTGAATPGTFGLFNAGEFTLTKSGPGTLNIRVPTTNFPLGIVSGGNLKAENFQFVLPTNVIVHPGAFVGTFGATITNSSAINLLDGAGIYNDGGNGTAVWLGPVTNAGAGAIISVLGTNGNGSHAFFSNIAGSGLISVIGGNNRNVDLYASNDVSFSGNWVVAGGTGLRAINEGTLGTGRITNYGTVDFLRTNSHTFPGSIYGVGLVRHLIGGGAQSLSGVLQAANVQAQGGGSNNAAPLTFAPGSQAFVSGTLSAGHANTGGRMIFNNATINAGSLFLGENASQTGIVEHVNAVVTVTNQVRLGHWPTEVSTYTMDGGSITVVVDPTANPSGGGEQNGGFYIGIDGVAVLNQNSGSLVTPSLVLDNRASSVLAPNTNTYNFNGGTLTLGRWGIQSPNSTYQINLGGGVIESSANWTSVLRMTLSGVNGDVTFNPASGRTNFLGGALTGTAGLIKNGAGTLFLTNAGNNIPGTVAVNNGTLHGNGILGGTLLVGATGTFSPGASAGVATATNVTLSGVTFMEVSRTGLSLINDRLVAAGTLAFGGTLTLANIGQTLIGGETFDLFDFNAGLSAGTFSSFNLPVLASHLSWDTSTLHTDGIVRVVGAPSITTGPASQTVYENDNVFFRATVEHFQPFTLQWRKDGVDIMNATNSVLAVTSVPLSGAGTYTIVASNLSGATFASAILTVLQATNLQAGLIAHWPLDATDGISTPDGSGNGNALFLTNLTAGEFAAGVRGNAVTFNGTNSLLTRTYTSGNVLPAYQYQAFTAAMWVKGTNGQVDRRVFSESSTIGNNQLVNLGTDNGGLSPKADVFLRNDAGAIAVNHGKSTNAAFDGTWHHVVLIDNNGTLQFYIDGVLDPYSNSYARTTFTLNTIAIGGIQRAVPGAWFSGQIDDVMVWRRTLNSNEVFCAYTNGLVRPVFTLQPANFIAECTGNASFSAAADSVDAVTYQWFRNGSPIPDATNASVMLTGVSSADHGSTYAVRARNCAGDTWSTAATLSVVDTTPPTIACPGNLTVACLDDVPAPQPGSVIASDTCDATLSVSHTGDVYTPGSPGVMVRTYTATDDGMNSANCQQIITVLVSRPAPLLAERFGPGGYMPGSLVGQSHAASGFAAGSWFLGSGDATVSTSGGLTFSSGPLTLQAAGGKVTTPAAGFNTVFATMNTAPAGPFGSAGLVDSGLIGGPNVSGTLYYSFLSRNGSSDVPNGDNDFAALQLYQGGAEIFGVGNNWGAWAYSTFGVGGDGDLIRPSDSSFLLMDNNVHLFVVRIDYVAGGNDTVSVWMDPQLDLPEGSQPANVYRRTVNGSAAFDRIALRSGSDNNNNSWDHDEIRFGTNWDDVTPTAPAIVAQPMSTAGECSQTASFSAAALGTGPLAYQWSKSGSPIANATNATLLLSNLQESDEGAYTVKACNPFGSVTSASANLTVNDTTPPILSCPAPSSVQCLANVPAPNTSLAFATDTCDPAPVISHVSDVSAGSNPTIITRTYRVTDSSGNTNDCITLINVQDTMPPVIVACAMDLLIISDTLLMAMVPDMRPGLSATDNCVVPSISQTPAPGSMVTSGVHLVMFTVLDGAGNSASCSAQLTVVPPAIAPIILSAPQNLAVDCGSNVVLTVVAAGVPPPEYQWFRGVNPIADATNASLSIPGATPPDSGVYSVTVSNLYGNTNVAATLTVTDPNPPVIVTQPASRTNNVGTSASFTVAVQSCSARTYQWCFGVNPLLDETNATLTLASVQLSDQGGYSVKVVNAAGAVTSVVAVLTVNRPPVAQPNGGATTENRPLSFALVKLVANDTDADGDPLTVTAVSATSTNGGSVVLGGGSATYTPLPGFIGVDRFTYTVSDGRGGTATAEVEVLVASGALPSFNQVSIRPTANGFLVRFAGIPGKSYQIQRSPDMMTWTTLTTAVAPLHGIIEYEDVNPPPGSAFYRTVAP